MKNITELVFYVYIYASGFAFGAVGFALFILGLIGFFGVEIRLWAFQYYFGGLILMLLGALILYGLHSASTEEIEEQPVIYLGPGGTFA